MIYFKIEYISNVDSFKKILDGGEGKEEYTHIGKIYLCGEIFIVHPEIMLRVETRQNQAPVKQ